MMFKSFKSQIIGSVITIVVATIIVAGTYFAITSSGEFTNSAEENTLNLLVSTDSYVDLEYNRILKTREEALQQRKKELRSETEIAFTILETSYATYLSGDKTEEEAKETAVNYIRNQRFD